MELEPYFVKALKLLHSKHPDSTEQLKQMLFDVLVQKKVKTEGKDEDDNKEKSKSNHRSKESSETKKREAEKRNIDKLKQEISDLAGASEAKKPKLEPSVSPAHKPGTPEHRTEKERDKERDSHKHKDKERSKEHKSKDKDKHDRDKEREKEKERDREKEKERERRKQEIAKARKIASSDDSSDESDGDQTQAKLDTDNFAMDMGIACVVCKQFDVQSGNQLVECQECHNLYHQECHKPPVTEKDVNDPRFVWYCTKCTKNMKKVVTKPHKAKSSSNQSTKEVVHESTFLKPLKATEAASLLQPFKRLETSKPSSGKETSRPFIGLAGLAANLSTKPETKLSGSKSGSSSVKLDPSKSGLAALASAASSKSSSSKSSSGGGNSSSSSGSGSNSKSSTSMMNAEKRMQSMKKKAASKQQDKKNAYK